jgi:MarR family transcriptional regulator, transcriptional regulator for hemolysin
VPRPTQPPIGIALTRAAKAVERAFDRTLADAGSSRPVWSILLAMRTTRPRNQTELAEAVGIRDATLSHHLAAMQDAGLITRERNPDNRRVHDLALTGDGDALFLALAGAARAHDRRLRRGLADGEVEQLRALLGQLEHNVEPGS